MPQGHTSKLESQRHRHSYNGADVARRSPRVVGELAVGAVQAARGLRTRLVLAGCKTSQESMLKSRTSQALAMHLREQGRQVGNPIDVASTSVNVPGLQPTPANERYKAQVMEEVDEAKKWKRTGRAGGAGVGKSAGAVVAKGHSRLVAERASGAFLRNNVKAETSAREQPRRGAVLTHQAEFEAERGLEAAGLAPHAGRGSRGVLVAAGGALQAPTQPNSTHN